MKNSADSSRFFAGILGAASLLSLLTANLAASATVNSVSLFGYETHFGCWFKDNFGVPCPVCGMTRSVVMALHGNLGEAFTMHFGGAPLVFGILLFGLAMVFFSFPVKFNKSRRDGGRIYRQVLTATAVYFGIVTIFSFVYWILRLFGYFQTLPELT